MQHSIMKIYLRILLLITKSDTKTNTRKKEEIIHTAKTELIFISIAVKPRCSRCCYISLLKSTILRSGPNEKKFLIDLIRLGHLTLITLRL